MDLPGEHLELFNAAFFYIEYSLHSALVLGHGSRAPWHRQ